MKFWKKLYKTSRHFTSPTTWEYPDGLFDWVKPYALSIGEWDKWTEEMKSKYPIRYFIYEIIPDILIDVKRFFRDIRWWILHRFHPKHRYHVVDLKLKPGYYDPDHQILYSCFSILQDYVNHEKKDGVVDWDQDEQKLLWQECLLLMDWWENIRPNREDVWLKNNPEPENDGFFLSSTKSNPDHENWIDRYRKEETKWDIEDDRMLQRLIRIRRSLWH